MDKVGALLERYRLVTVTGPGGVGKTRLAYEVIGKVGSQYADGVCVVELAAVHEGALVPAVVAIALGLQQPSGISVTDAIAARLSRQQLLLVLDNCEHLLNGAAEFCAQLLSGADDIRILATSREPLGLQAEARYRLLPLAVPGPAGGPAEDVEVEAVTLFLERARQVDPELVPDDGARVLIGRLVRRLDGMPLAIELAAARVEGLGLAQLLELLDDRLRLLVSSDRSVAARQRSLEATVDWSYRLLAAAEQRVFRFLAVFPGPFPLQAAEVVAGAGTRLAVLRLVDCSLLSPPRVGPDGQARYAMLESLRSFGLDRLRGSSEREAAEAALAGYALGLAERAAVELADQEREAAAAVWLDAEDVTLHQGLTWALDHDPTAALRLAVALVSWWVLRGRWNDGHALLRRAIACNRPSTSGWYTANVLLVDLSQGSSDYQGLADQASVVVDALRDGPPTADLAAALSARSGALRNMGSLAGARADAGVALEVARRIGYTAGEALALIELGFIALYAGQFQESLQWARQAQLLDMRRIPARQARWVRLLLSVALINNSYLAEAREVLRVCLTEAGDAGDRGLQADILHTMARLARKAGDYAEARIRSRESAQIASTIGYPLALDRRPG